MCKKCCCKIITFEHMNLYLLLILLGAGFKVAKQEITAKSNKFGEKIIKIKIQ